MQSLARDEYLTTQVLTATPQKLQLLLVEGALRSSKRADAFLANGAAEAAIDALLHAQRIMARLIGSLNYLEQPRLAGQMAAVYGFIYKSLVLAQVRRDRARLADGIRVLQVERETWRLACEKFDDRRSDDPRAGGATESRGLMEDGDTRKAGGPPAPHHRNRDTAQADSPAETGRISFEA